MKTLSPSEEYVALLVSAMESRSTTYELLSRLFRVEVDEDFLSELKAMRFPAHTGNELVDRGYRSIVTYLSNARGNVVTELAVDYARTFIGHSMDAYGAAYPFESVYTNAKRLRMQDARDEVLAVYRSVGMDASSEWIEPEDHIAVELVFMRMLSDRAAENLKDGKIDAAYANLRHQEGFLNEHLGVWAPLLAKDMRSFAQTGFYQGLADALEGFLDLDRLLVNSVFEEDESDAA